MKKRSTLFRTILVVLLISLLAFSGCSTFAPSIDSNAESSQLAKFKSHSYKGNSLIRYPEIYGINKNAAAKINSTFKKAAEKTYKSYLSVKNEEKKVPKKELCKKTARCKYSFNSLYKIKYNSKSKLSIYYSEYTYTGHGKTNVILYNFDLSTGKQYKINDILKTTKNYKKVQKYAFKYLSTHNPYADSVLQLSDVTVNKNSQFLFTNDGIYLFFTNYKNYIPSYDDGDPYIKIPKTVYQ